MSEVNRPEFVTYKEFAEKHVCMSERQVRKLAAEGVIPVIRLGHKLVRVPVQRALKQLEELSTV